MVVRWKQLKNIRLSPISLILKCDSIIFEMHVNSEDSHVEVIFSNIMHHWKVDIMDKSAVHIIRIKFHCFSFNGFHLKATDIKTNGQTHEKKNDAFFCKKRF